jgi:hypothetical protein
LSTACSQKVGNPGCAKKIGKRKVFFVFLLTNAEESVIITLEQLFKR